MKKPLSKSQFVQYYRQILLSEVGELGQQALLQSHVLVVGVGGLGTHVTQQLAAAGIGHLYLMDGDSIELSNLPRQILFGPHDIGQSKVSVAARQLQQQYEYTAVQTCPYHFNHESMQTFMQQQPTLQQAIVDECLIVLDCSDNMPTRQSINQWCVQQQTPLVSAAISSFSGQLLVVDTKHAAQAGCYRCIYPEQAPTQNCQDMGVLGPAVGVMASMQALLTVKYLLKIGVADTDLHVFDGLNLHWRKLKRTRDVSCAVCQTPRLPTTHSTSHEELTL
ncbi:HesA/MoeB/ThiF family protein [Paraglaciecola sp.]|uniref:HesA/MoeB/ThiF family protein n=1 Tax=Paraglaciecola sp. TaxID=1920173 RepID=UPI0030F4AF76